MKHKRTRSKKKLALIRKKRILFFPFLFLFFFSLIGYTLCKLILLEGKNYQRKLEELTNKVVEGTSAPRGRIYDKNHKLLVDNKQVPTIYYQKSKDRSVQEEIKLAYDFSEIIELPFQKLNLINLKKFFLVEYPEIANSKITEEEKKKLKERQLTNRDIELLKIERITEEDLKIYTDREKKAAYVYYLMNKGYSYDEKTIKNEFVTDEEIAYLVEHQEQFPGFFVKQNWERVYLYGDTFRTILGNVSTEEQGIPIEEQEYYQKLGYSLNDRVGISYLEKQYENYLHGTKEQYIITSNHSKELIQEARRGHDIVLTIDIELQREVDRILSEQLIKAKKEPNTEYFNRSYVVIQDPSTGEILAMSGKKVILENGQYVVRDDTPGILTSPMTPGSVVKGASMLVGYNTKAVQIGEYMIDECVKIAGTPKKCSHANLGRINDITALAQSSNVYQFKIAMRVGGANYQYGSPLKINPEAFSIYRNTFKEFGLGIKTGIDLPIESLGYIGTKTDPGLLLDLSMGQYDTYTPIQLSQYITTIASNGIRYQPHLLKEVYAPTNQDDLGELVESKEPNILNKVTTEEAYLKRVQEGFRAVMTTGLGKGVMGTAPTPAGKTGTSESFLDTNNDGKIDSESVSNAFVGYAPYNNPKMTITVTSPDVEKPSKYTYHSYVNRRIAREISSRFFELYPNYQ